VHIADLGDQRDGAHIDGLDLIIGDIDKQAYLGVSQCMRREEKLRVA